MSRCGPRAGSWYGIGKRGIAWSILVKQYETY
ncbi:hypothetical protein J2851_007027, partial [Azospirillum rugosum]|nr:hypothetical protein [Azospirillum rugosum]MDQ0531049.1 hypothetical protein [Azospirillum rugosum]